MPRKDKIDIVLTVLFSSVTYASFTSTILILMLKNHITDPLYLALAILSQKFIKLFVETPIGVIADAHGTKRLFLLVPIIMILDIPLIKLNTTSSIIACLVLHGLCISLKTGKIEGRIYNTLKKNKTHKTFPRLMSILFICSDITMGIVSYTAGIIHIKYGNNAIFFGIALNAAIGLICIAFMTSDKTEKTHRRTSKKDILAGSVKFMIRNKAIMAASLVLALCNFFGWQFGHIVKIIFAEHQTPTYAIMKFHGLSQLTMAIGAIISLVVASRISVIMSITIWLLQILVITATAINSSKITIFGASFPIVALSYLLYPIFYATMQIPIIKYIEDHIPQRSRITITSFANLLAITINIILNILIGFLARYNGSYLKSTVPMLIGAFVIGVLQLPVIYKTIHKPKKHRHNAKKPLKYKTIHESSTLPSNSSNSVPPPTHNSQ